MNNKFERSLPNSKESEMMVLGSMLNSVNALNFACDFLFSSDFFYKEHRLIFDSILSFYCSERSVDVHIISEELKRRGSLQEIGGIDYLMNLSQYASTSAYIEEYSKNIKDKSILRMMINSAQKIEKSAIEQPEDVMNSLDIAQKMFFDISQQNTKDIGASLELLLSGEKSKSQKPFLKELQEKQEEYQKNGGKNFGISGIPTYFNDLDKLINGLGNSNLLILAARPAMGKTALAVNIAENVCFKSNIPVGIFSLEMSAEQLLNRIVCSHAEVEAEKLSNGSINGEEYQKIVSSVNEIMRHTMIIDDQPGLRITDLRSRARRMKETYGIGLLIIDYLQLLSGSSTSKYGDNRQNEISEISRMLKNLARELDIPVICLSQLSRRVEERTGHRPMMSDLRESGSIEQDADIVLFLLRREYYDPSDKPGMAELIVAKNRHGSVGNLDLIFRKEIPQFMNYSKFENENVSDEFSDFYI